jgi:hypothetical protein
VGGSWSGEIPWNNYIQASRIHGKPSSDILSTRYYAREVSYNWPVSGLTVTVFHNHFKANITGDPTK